MLNFTNKPRPPFGPLPQGALPREAPDGTELEWDIDKSGVPKSRSYRNAYSAIIALDVECSYDTFHNRKYADGAELSDATARELRERVVLQWRFDPGKSDIQEALERRCEANKYDPVADYLDRVEKQWDGQERLETFFQTYFGAADTALNRKLGATQLIAAVRRVRQPGFPYDIIPVLSGKVNGGEGLGKSKALCALAGPENFTDQKFLGVKDQQSQELTQGKWIYELCELEGMTEGQIERMKAQVSRTADRGRPAYGRYSVEQPRTCVFFGTTNEEEYLKGDFNRRWVPVNVTKADVEGIIRDRDQLWGEAATWESAMAEMGTTLELPEDVWGDAKTERAKHTTRDPWESELRYVSGFPHPIEGGRYEERISTHILLTDRLNIPKHQQDVGTAKRLSRVMRAIGWEKHFMQFGTGADAQYLNGYRRMLPPEYKFSEPPPSTPPREAVEKAFKSKD